MASALLVKVLLLCMPTQLYIYLIFSTSVIYILIRPFSTDCQLFKKNKTKQYTREYALKTEG